MLTLFFIFSARKAIIAENERREKLVSDSVKMFKTQMLDEKNNEKKTENRNKNNNVWESNDYNAYRHENTSIDQTEETSVKDISEEEEEKEMKIKMKILLDEQDDDVDVESKGPSSDPFKVSESKTTLQ